MRQRAALALLSLTLVAAGCGGGGAAGLSTGPDPQTQVGPMSVQGDVRALAPTVTSGGATLYAVKGSVNGATMMDASPTVEETEVYFVSDRSTGISIMACSPDGSGLRVLTPTAFITQMQVFGGFVYFVETTDSINYTLKRVNSAGGIPSTVKANVSHFTLNPSATKIYGYQLPTANWPQGRFMSFNPDGSGVAHMFPPPTALGPFDYLPGVTSDGSLVWADYVNGVGMTYKAYSLGGVLRSSTDLGYFPEAVSMENGKDIVYDRYDSVFYRNDIGYTTIWPRGEVGIANRYDNRSAVSPGGTHFAFSNNGAEPGIYVHAPGDAAGLKIHSNRGRGVAWGPLITQRDFFAGTGFSSAGALLFSERGLVLPAVVWADATTRNTIMLTKVSADGAQNVVYRLDCDQVTRLAYSNSLNYTPVNVAGATAAGIKGAFISFSADSGKVASITTFKGTVSALLEDGFLKVSGADAVFKTNGEVIHGPGTLFFK